MPACIQLTLCFVLQYLQNGTDRQNQLTNVGPFVAFRG